MIVKLLVFVVVLLIIYVAFFKKASPAQKKKETEDKKIGSDIMIECSECSTFVSEKEAIIKDGKFFCSKQCAKLR
jgi:uncharacterized protein